MSELAVCSTCGYRWVSAGWTCPRCGYAPRVSSYDEYQDEPGCAETCLVPVGCLVVFVLVPLFLLGVFTIAMQWQTWVLVGIGAVVAGVVALYRYQQRR